MVKHKQILFFVLISFIFSSLFLSGCATSEEPQKASNVVEPTTEEQSEKELRDKNYNSVYVGIVQFDDGIKANCSSFENFECVWSKDADYSYEQALGDFVSNEKYPEVVYDNIAKSSLTYPDYENGHLDFKKVLLDDRSITYCAYISTSPQRFDCVVVFPSGSDTEIIKDTDNKNW
jgi:hypothetical protein